ncbi:MAG TPA: response regulator transcription factor [Sulfuricurvum sp.]|nr:response regulator transcription factor [Sulfuricurvum sp.]
MAVRKKVLIVDDDEQTRKIIQKVLKRLDEVDFLEAGNGSEAIQMANDEQPDLILMDVVMPGMDGYEACRKIKNDPKMKSAIVIFMTSLTMDEIDDKIIQARGDDLLRKPLDASELYFRVKNYLTLVKHNKDEIRVRESLDLIEWCNLYNDERTINLGRGFLYQSHSKSLCNKNQRIPLMKQEMLLLEALINHKNKVLYYEELLDVIATHNETTMANIRTLVKLLRRKTYKELIRTLPSVGYQLVI